MITIFGLRLDPGAHGASSICLLWVGSGPYLHLFPYLGMLPWRQAWFLWQVLWWNQCVPGSLYSISLAMLNRGASGLGNRGVEGQIKSSLRPGGADLGEPE